MKCAGAAANFTSTTNKLFVSLVPAMFHSLSALNLLLLPFPAANKWSERNELFAGCALHSSHKTNKFICLMDEMDAAAAVAHH